jgi:hypothetical protein
MCAENIASFVDKIAAFIGASGVFLDEFGVFTVFYKTDILTVLFVGVNKSVSIGYFPDIGFCKFAEREERMT